MVHCCNRKSTATGTAVFPRVSPGLFVGHSFPLPISPLCVQVTFRLCSTPRPHTSHLAGRRLPEPRGSCCACKGRRCSPWARGEGWQHPTVHFDDTPPRSVCLQSARHATRMLGLWQRSLSSYRDVQPAVSLSQRFRVPFCIQHCWVKVYHNVKSRHFL